MSTPQRWRVTGPTGVVEFTVDTFHDPDDPLSPRRIEALARLTRRIHGAQRIELQQPDGTWRIVFTR